MKELDFCVAGLVGGGDPGLVVVVPPGSGGPNMPPGPFWDPITGTWRVGKDETYINP